jgi:hypothetical protein
MLVSEGLKSLNDTIQRVKSEGTDLQMNLEEEVNQIPNSKTRNFFSINKTTKEINIRAKWLKFRAACWAHLDFNQFGIGSAEKVEGKRSCFVAKRFITYIFKYLYANTEAANDEDKQKREKLIAGINKVYCVIFYWF